MGMNTARRLCPFALTGSDSERVQVYTDYLKYGTMPPGCANGAQTIHVILTVPCVPPFGRGGGGRSEGRH